MKVRLINKDEVKDFYKKWGLFSCKCYDTNPKFAERVGKSCHQSGHYSGSRSFYFIFDIDDVPRSCYDEKTEILTKEGWKYFKDISNDEVVATLNDNTQQVEFHKINEKIEYDYEGKMHYLKSTNLDLAITDNHNVYYRKHDIRVNKEKTYLTPIGDINFNRLSMTKEFNYNNVIDENFEIKGYEYEIARKDGRVIKKHTGDLLLNRKLFYKLLAWYLSDGSTYYCKKENKYVITISQTTCEKNIKNGTREEIYNIIKQLGFTPVYDKTSVKFNSMTLGRYFKKLGLSYQKNIPFNLYENFNQELAYEFVHEYFKGDGHIDKNGCGKFYTSSKILADQLQQIAFIAGYTAMIYTRGENLVGTKQIVCGKEVNVNHIGYVVNVSMGKTNKRPHVDLKRQRVVKEEKLRVYCVNVENNIIFVRRNGRAVWCGNCIDQLARHEQGVVKNIKSQRYTDSSELEYYIPDVINKYDDLVEAWTNGFESDRADYQYIVNKLEEYEGYTGEKAREVARGRIGMDIHSSATVGFTIEALEHFMHKRICFRSQEGIRKLANLIKQEVIEVLPELKEYLVPTCTYLGYCTEGKHQCSQLKNVYPTKEEFKEIINSSEYRRLVKEIKSR